jgi:hypothetical protein
MKPTRLIPLTALLFLFGLFAVPAQATLRVESTSTGLNVIDKNGFGSTTTIAAATQGGNPVYVIITDSTSLDFIKYDFGPNCSQGSTNTRAVCKRLSGKLNLSMGGGNDHVFTAESGATTVSANLGTVNDRYVGGPARDDVFAASGNDEIETGGGDDDITLSTGSEDADGGSGNDTIDISGSLVEGSVLAHGGSGNDTLDMRGATGALAHADSGDDTVIGSSDGDFITGGTGVDDLRGENGDDLIRSKESDEDKTSFRDTVRCGFDDDDVVADLKDTVDVIGSSTGGTCEEVDRSPIGETPHVRILGKSLRVSPSGRVRVRLRCPRGVRRLGCRGHLQLQLSRNRNRAGQAPRARASRKVRDRIKAGRRKIVTLQLTARDVRTLRRRQRRGLQTRGILTSVERGRLGDKTTIRNPRLRLR